ncbi:MAG: hypothetical protein IPJ71_19345 [Bdellovibrionales bacterium]|nr:hypothetical protein [Bdellovibrionales bacterium]
MKRSIIPLVVLAFIFTSYTEYSFGDALFQFRQDDEVKTSTRLEKKQSTDDRELYPW